MLHLPYRTICVSLACALCLFLNSISPASAAPSPLNDNTEFVKQVYLDFLNREPDTDGLNFWSNSLDAGTMNRSDLVEMCLISGEFQGNIAPVVRLYFTYFLRIPDYEGLMFWVNGYAAGMSLNDISDAFASSQEFIERYGSLTNEEFVSQMYVNVYGREPDAGGLAFWTGHLDAGNLTRGQVMVEFSSAEEYQLLSFNEVYVTMTYIGLMRRAPDQGGFDFWVDSMDQGVSGLGLIDGFLVSEEYANRFSNPYVQVVDGEGSFNPDTTGLLVVNNNSDGTAHITSEKLATIYDLVIKDAEGNPLPDVSVNYYESGGKSIFHLVDESKTYADVFVTGAPENLLTVFGNPSAQSSRSLTLTTAALIFSMTVLYYEQYKFTVNAYTAAQIYDDSYAPGTCEMQTSQPYESFCMTPEQIAELVKARYGMSMALTNIAISFVSAGIPAGEGVKFSLDAGGAFLGGFRDYLIEELMERAVLSKFEATNRKFLVRVFPTDGEEFGDNVSDLFTRFEIDYDCTECNEEVEPPYVSPAPQVWFKDSDLDGYGDAYSTPVVSESAPTDHYLIEELFSPDTDCIDNYSSINPAADEICDDGIDQDCNGSDLACIYERYIDNGDGTIYDKQTGLTWQQDNTPSISGYFANGVYHPLYNPDRMHQGCADLELGAFTSWRVPTSSELESLVDQDYYPKINPLFKTITGYHSEYWQRYWTSDVVLPDNCYIVDFDTGKTKLTMSGYEESLRCVVGENWYLDNDLDGYSEGTFVTGTYPPTDRYFSSESLHAISGDCNDYNINIYPTAAETCGDGVDQDCDGTDQLCAEDIDADGDGFASDIDCNDWDASIHPGASEICGDGIDQDCDLTDRDCTTTVVNSSLPDTGLVICYDDNGNIIDCPGTGQDGEYLSNPMSFIDNGNNTVTDGVTGLLWQKSDDDIVRNWVEANTYCSNLSLGDVVDWRLPTFNELLSIHDFSTYNPTINSVFLGTYSSDDMLTGYWTSTISPAFADRALVLYYYVASAIGREVSQYHYVRCVSGINQPTDLVNNQNGTFTDTKTGLMWQELVDNTLESWADKLNYCNDLSLAGYNDWRLPDIKELASLGDIKELTPLGPFSVNDFWSSTTNIEYPWSAQYYSPWSGQFNGNPKVSALKSAICVR